jgi:hypothetical protein
MTTEVSDQSTGGLSYTPNNMQDHWTGTSARFIQFISIKSFS